jgi:UDP-N-acetylglucosamine enolpyruvyl transferase
MRELLVAPLVAPMHEAKVSLPGCAIGTRAIDLLITARKTRGRDRRSICAHRYL